MKICILIPCLMAENNRKANYEAMEFAKTYGADEIVVYDQEYQLQDYRKGFKANGSFELVEAYRNVPHYSERNQGRCRCS